MPLTNKVSEKDVSQLFSRIAPKYDLMNDVISLGVQRKWRRKFLASLNIKANDNCLDLCCGTGDSIIDIARQAQSVIGLDFNRNMLTLAQRKIRQKHLHSEVKLIQGDAMNLPFKDKHFNCVTICFGLRNVPDAGKTIAEAYRVLKPGGRFGILEMSQPTNPLVKLGWKDYFAVFPYFAKLTGNRVEDYRYLAQTSKAFLSANQLKRLLLKQGFREVKISKLTFGAGAVHLAIK